MATRLPVLILAHVRDIALIGIVLFLGLDRGLAAFAQDSTVSPRDAALTHAFAYQGRLTVDGLPADGLFDLEFELFDGDAPAGVQVAAPLPQNAVPVTGGVFTVPLDFGSSPFTGRERWIEVRARPSGNGPMVTVGRTRLDATPYAIFASGAPFSGLTGVPQGLADGDDMGWGLSGDAGTTPGTNFIGTTDDVPFEVRVNGLRALQISPSVGAPNILFGAANNSLGTATSSVIGGGATNSIATGSYNVLGGGSGNQVTGTGTNVLAGGSLNDIDGYSNFIAGGRFNAAVGEYGSVGGGTANQVAGFAATVPGGTSNRALGDDSFAAGNNANAVHDLTFVWSDEWETSGGFSSAIERSFIISATNGVAINRELPQADLDVATDVRIRGEDLTNLLVRGSGDDIVLDFIKESDGPGTNVAASIMFNGYTSQSTHRALLEFQTRGTGDAEPLSRLVIDEDGSVRPGANSTSGTTGYSLGTTSFRWREVWAQDGSVNTSDARLKTNIENLQPGLAEVLQLRPVSYAWKDGDPGEVRLGLLAQDVREVLPSVVRGNDIDGLGMSYDEFIPVLIRAIQEQQVAIEAKSPGAESNESLAGGGYWLAIAFVLGAAVAAVSYAIGRTRVGSARN